MKAVLVYWSPITRVIVPDNATDEDIEMIAQSQIRDKLESDFLENIEKIVLDIEVPYDPEFDND